MREKKSAGRKPRLAKPEMIKREKAIIADIKAGELSYREIALKNGVSLPTVNNKARKAGISRGRRKGAKLIVPRPGRKVGVRKAARRPVKKAARRVKKAGSAMLVSAAPAARRARKTRVARKVRRRIVRRVGRPRGVAGAGNARFSGAFRQLVLKHFPSISLVKFDRLAKLVEHEIR